MAVKSSIGGSGGGGGGIDWTAVSPLAIPELLALFQRIQGAVPSVPSFEPIFERAAGLIPEDTESFESILESGTASPLIQQVLQLALPGLATGEAQAREALTDRFRAAGGLRGGAYGVAAPRLEGELAAKRGSLMSQIISSMLPSLISGSLQAQRNAFLPAEAFSNLLNPYLQAQRNQFLPVESLINLLQASRPQVSFDRSGGGFGGQPSSQDLLKDFATSNITGKPVGDVAGTQYDPFRDFLRPSTKGPQPQPTDTYDPFSPLNPGKTFAEKLEFARSGSLGSGTPTFTGGLGVGTGSLNDIFLDPFSDIYTNLGSGAFEY